MGWLECRGIHDQLGHSYSTAATSGGSGPKSEVRPKKSRSTVKESAQEGILCSLCISFNLRRDGGGLLRFTYPFLSGRERHRNPQLAVLSDVDQRLKSDSRKRLRENGYRTSESPCKVGYGDKKWITK